jgi:hypothetical protein
MQCVCDERATSQEGVVAERRSKLRAAIHIDLILVATLTALRHPQSAARKLLSSAGLASQCRVELIEKLRVAS